MNQRERQLLHEEVGDKAEARLCVRSRARIDAGRWWRRTPVWLCVVADELVMLAVARRRYVARVAIANCQQSHYNHATGELVIEPGEALQFSKFPLSPRDALGIIDLIQSKDKISTTKN
ncbi:MAG: hypothetical protein ACI8XO_001426 [Verrucomicrobiales bacterium]|jgi:hypothetical protein